MTKLIGRCNTYQEAINNYMYGCDALYLEAASILGGLTPSLGTFISINQETDAQIYVNVNLAKNDVLDQGNINMLFLDTTLFLEAGCSGISFTFVDENEALIDFLIKDMVSVIHEYEKAAIFNLTNINPLDFVNCCETLIDLKVDKIIINETQFFQNKEVIKELQKDIEFILNTNFHEALIAEALDIKIDNILSAHPQEVLLPYPRDLAPIDIFQYLEFISNKDN